MSETHAFSELQPGVDWRVLFEKHGILFAAGFTWHPRPGDTASFQKRWYFSQDECDKATAETLRLMGYERPRWWQWWRWSEVRLDAKILKLVEAYNAPTP